MLRGGVGRVRMLLRLCHTENDETMSALLRGLCGGAQVEVATILFSFSTQISLRSLYLIHNECPA
jgi:hypothetical protein